MAKAERRHAQSARTIAARALLRVEQDGAFAAAALDSELSRVPELDPRERALATELVYGTLRSRSSLSRRLEALAPRGLPDPLVRAHLLIAAYQILALERVPAFAAVDAAVEEVTRVRGTRVGGFVNALLRKLSASPQKLSQAELARESSPAWLYERLSRVVGTDEAEALLGARGVTPRLTLRLFSGKPLPEWLLRAEPSRFAPSSLYLPEGSGDPRKQAGFAEGAFSIQEEGAQLVALALGARPGERVLDACAGRGQKTAILREQVGADAELWATDLHPRKLEQLAAEFERLGLAPPERKAVDWSVGSSSVPEGFDRALVDAPCTGTGTLRKRPEILDRLTPEDPARLGELQSRILREVSTRVRPGGRVVFAVCSVLEEEGEAVVEQVRDVLTPVEFDAPEIAKLAGASASALRLLPGRHGTDGYFLASFCKR